MALSKNIVISAITRMFVSICLTTKDLSIFH